MSLPQRSRETTFSTVSGASDETQPRKKRKLNYSKCEYCRRAKKRCEPSDGQWPSKKCTRCMDEDLPCSEIVTQKAGGIPRPKRTSDGIARVEELELPHSCPVRSALPQSTARQSPVQGGLAPEPASSPEELQDLLEEVKELRRETKISHQLIAKHEVHISQLQKMIDKHKADADASRRYIKATTGIVMSGLRQLSNTQMELCRILMLLADGELYSVVQELLRPESIGESMDALRISFLIAAREGLLATGKLFVRFINMNPKYRRFLGESWAAMSDLQSIFVAGTNPLVEASIQGRTAFVQMLLNSAWCSAAATDTKCRTALWHAAAEGHESIVHLFLAHPRPTAMVCIHQTDVDGVSPLNAAISKNRLGCMNSLLGSRKIDINANCSLRLSGLELINSSFALAVFLGHSVLVHDLLMRSEVNIRVRDRRGRTLQEIASSSHDGDLLRQLESILRVQSELNLGRMLTPHDLAWPTNEYLINRRGQLDFQHRAEWDAAVILARRRHVDAGMHSLSGALTAIQEDRQ